MGSRLVRPQSAQATKSGSRRSRLADIGAKRAVRRLQAGSRRPPSCCAPNGSSKISRQAQPRRTIDQILGLTKSNLRPSFQAS
jgi:hypothetical protein